MEVMPTTHKPSMSDSSMRKGQEDFLSSSFVPCDDSKLRGIGFESCAQANNRQSLGTEIQKTSKQEILQLQKQLEDQFFERSALEKALTNEAFHDDPTNKNSISKSADDLIKEISVLEFEVLNLEKYLLSLYRKSFLGKISNFPETDQNTESRPNLPEFQAPDILSKKNNSMRLQQNLVENPSKPSGEFSAREINADSSIHRSLSSLSQRFDRSEMIADSSVHRSHSSLSHRFDRSLETSHHVGILSEAVNPYHSLPLSMLEHVQEDYRPNSTSLREFLHKNIQDAISETPNWISEEMIKTISSIYIELVEPPLVNHGFPSFSSPISDSSPGKWNLDERRNSVFPSWIESPVPNSSVVEVQSICRNSRKLQHVKQTLQHFRSLVSRLKKIDLRRMKNEEKLAFWINIHNSLVMHAYLIHGISKNSMKRTSFVLKAAYNVGGYAISVDMIQSSILGCRLPRPGQWLHSLFSPKMKFKVKDARRAYAVEHPEPRLYFALSSGRHSDPLVRLYTPKSIFQDLEAAKEDYMQTNFSINKQGKILLPKIVDLFAKESSLCPSEFLELFGYLIPHSLRKSFQLQDQSGNFWKRIQWVQHNFAFRFLISKELVSGI